MSRIVSENLFGEGGGVVFLTELPKPKIINAVLSEYLSQTAVIENPRKVFENHLSLAKMVGKTLFAISGFGTVARKVNSTTKIRWEITFKAWTVEVVDGEVNLREVVIPSNWGWREEKYVLVLVSKETNRVAA